ncbi:MAG: hypothetical protein U5K72_04305 [Balneolaceae bacterium]|nr:hypothetical protein [Balneolaceae bacterium]
MKKDQEESEKTLEELQKKTRKLSEKIDELENENVGELTGCRDFKSVPDAIFR